MLSTPIVYGAGQYMYSYNGAAVVEHDGAVAGFRSLVSRMPDLGVGVAVFSNDEVNGGDLMRLVSTRVYDTVLGIAPADSSSTDGTGSSNRSVCAQPTYIHDLHWIQLDDFLGHTSSRSKTARR